MRDEAVQLLLYARPFLAQRIMCDPFFGDLNNMARLIHDLYELIEFDTSSVKLYDLYYLLQKPCRVTFRLADRRYEVEADFL